MAGENTTEVGAVSGDEFLASWRAKAECLGIEDPNLFFPEGNTGRYEAQIEEALGLCAVCEVKEECLEFALVTNQNKGIWGGLEEDDRKRYRKRWLADKRRTQIRE